MNADPIYSNPGLEARRLALLGRLRAEEAPRIWYEADFSPDPQVEQGFCSERGQSESRLTRWIAESAKLLTAGEREAFRTLLLALRERNALLLNYRRHVAALSRLARFSSRWVRTPAGVCTCVCNADEQFGELARYLFARWPVPKFFDDAWSERSTDRHRGWFIHLGAGGNLRTAPGLPIPLTKMMAHHALLVPDRTSIIPALRWGQVRALGGSERMARAVMHSLLRDVQDDEPFWLTVLQFFVANPSLGPHQVVPITDWIQNQRFVPQPRRIVNGMPCGGGIPQPSLTMKGRTVESVVRHVHNWHRELNRAAISISTRWATCGIPGYERIEGSQELPMCVRIDEILNSADLQMEGRAMNHCVASCAHGFSAIYSLKRDDGFGYERRVTVQVDVATKRIVQACGRFNVRPAGLDEHDLRNWASAAGLAVASF